MQDGGYSLNIQNRDTIRRILEKICGLKLTVFIRSPSFGNAVIKGVASHLASTSSDTGQVFHCLCVSHLSKEALSYLQENEAVSFEFVMVSAMLVGKSRVVSFHGEEVALEIPKELSNIERRQGMRHRTGKNHMAFIKTNLWPKNPDGPDGSLSFLHFKHLGKMIELSDISITGFCASTRIISLSNVIHPEQVDNDGVLQLPMIAPVPIRFKVQWVKKVSGLINDKKANKLYPPNAVFLFGCQFIDLSEEAKQAVGGFIQTVIESDAI